MKGGGKIRHSGAGVQVDSLLNPGPGVPDFTPPFRYGFRRCQGLGTAQRHFRILLDSWAARKSILGVGGRETLSKGGGRSTQLFGRVSRPPGAARTPQNRRSPAGPKIQENWKISLSNSKTQMPCAGPWRRSNTWPRRRRWR